MGESNFFKILARYLEARFDLLRLDVQERISKIIIFSVEITIILILAGSFLLFANLTLAFYLNYVVESQFMGFLIVALTQVFLLGIIWVSRSALARKFEEYMLEAIDKEEHKDKKDEK